MQRESNTLRFDQWTYNLVCVHARVCVMHFRNRARRAPPFIGERKLN